MPKVSVIIPCYNQGKYINETVNSVLNQTFTDFEIIIVNDGSTDKYTNSLLQNHNKPKTKVLFTKNKGVSSARNTAINASTGEYILPLDGDDKLHPNFLELTIKCFQEKPNLKLVYTEVSFFGEKEGKWNLKAFDFKQILLNNQIVCTALYRRNDFNKTKGYDTSMKEGHEDWDFWLSFLKDTENKQIYRIPEILFYYRVLSSSRDRSITKTKRDKLAYQIYFKHLESYKKYYTNPLEAFLKIEELDETIQSIQKSRVYKFAYYIVFFYKSIKKIWE